MKKKEATPGDTKVTQYLQQMAQFNEQQQKIKDKKREGLKGSSENGSNGGNNSGGSNNSNLAYLDSSSGGKNNSGLGPISAPNVGSSGGSGSSGNKNIQYVPIMVVCCPNILKGESCLCGHQSFVTMPSQLQLHQYLS